MLVMLARGACAESGHVPFGSVVMYHSRKLTKVQNALVLNG
jgi:hypothetical protein